MGESEQGRVRGRGTAEGENEREEESASERSTRARRGMKMRDKTYSVVKTLLVLGSQNLMRLSFDPETSSPLVGCHFTHFTSHPWPARAERGFSTKNLTQRSGAGRECKEKPTRQRLLLPHHLEIPNLDGAIITPRGKAIIIRGPSNISHALSVSLEHLEVVHVGLKVLDEPGVVGGDEPLARV